MVALTWRRDKVIINVHSGNLTAPDTNYIIWRAQYPIVLYGLSWPSTPFTNSLILTVDYSSGAVLKFYCICSR